jgi:hypothetical protein
MSNSRKDRKEIINEKEKVLYKKPKCLKADGRSSQVCLGVFLFQE